MNIQRKLALVSAPNKKLHFIVGEVDIDTNKLITRGYLTKFDITTYLKNGSYWGTTGHSLEVQFYTDSLEEIVSQIQILKVLKPETLDNYLLTTLAGVAKDMGIAYDH